MNLNQLSYVGGSASPFINAGDSLVAHAGGYKMILGAHNTVDVTVECQMHVGGYVAFFRYGRCQYLHKLLMPRGMQGVSPCSLGTVNPDAHNTVDA